MVIMLLLDMGFRGSTCRFVNKRVTGGKVAKRRGDEFEDMLKLSAQREGFHVTRMPNGCETKGYNKIMRVKTPYDFIFIKSRTETFFADAKATAGRTFSHSKIVPHQLEELLKIEQKGGVAGYIVFFRQTSEIVWFSASTLNSISARESLTTSKGVLLGTLFNLRFGVLFV